MFFNYSKLAALNAARKSKEESFVQSIESDLLSVLDVAAFERLLGPCLELMQRNIELYKDQLSGIFGTKTIIGQP